MCVRIYQCVNNTVINQSRECLVNKSETPGGAHHDNAVGCLFRGAFDTSKQHSEHTCIVTSASGTLASNRYRVFRKNGGRIDKQILIFHNISNVVSSYGEFTRYTFGGHSRLIMIKR